MKTGIYRSKNRLTFKRYVMDQIDEDGIYVNEIESLGVFEISKKDFYNDFSNVVSTESWIQGTYSYKQFPSWANHYLKTKNIQPATKRITKKEAIENNQIDFVGKEIREKIREIGKLWNRNQNKRVFPEPAYSDWQKLIEFWRDCPDLPLVIRKNKEHRGESIIHPSGREIIFSDNSFATWVLCNVLENKTITVLEIKKLLDDDQIPFMMVANKNAKYKKTQEPNTTDGWKLCHKEEVGFKTRKSVNELDIKLIERKFFLFANPKNMFLLPKDIGGIGEIKEFIEEQTN